MQADKFFSQKGQDEWVVKEVFHHRRGGYFVDLAATNGISMNNTYVLETIYDWTGICIEPNPAFYEQLVKARKCHTSHFVVDEANDQIVRFRTDNKECGGIVAGDTDNNPRLRREQLNNATIIELKTKTLETILDEVGAPPVIDYLSLDVEGAETRVLKNFPFDKYTFLCMTIERPTPVLNKLLFAAGYVFVKNVKFDTFYVHKSIPSFTKIKKRPFYQIPRKAF